MVEERVAAELSGLDDSGPLLAAERQAISALDAVALEQIDGLCDGAGVAVRLRWSLDRVVWASGDDAVDPGRGGPVEDRGVLSLDELACGADQVVEVNVLGAAVAVEQL